MEVQRYFFIIVLSALLALPDSMYGRVKQDTTVINRIFRYAASVDTSGIEGTHTYAYQRFFINTKKRNPILMAVPTMYGIAHGGARSFAGEFYDKVDFHSYGHYDTKRVLDINTIPHRRRTLTTILKYLTPEIYHTTIVDKYILSPFNKVNRRFYRYKTIYLDNRQAKVIFKAKVDNTQLVSGRATVDIATGRIISVDFYGEYDMLRFRLSLQMGDEGLHSLLPVRCEMNGRFKFVGSHITASYLCHYGMNTAVDDSLHLVYGQSMEGDSIIRETMSRIRPEPLTAEEDTIFSRYFREQLYRQQQRALEEQLLASMPEQEQPKKKKNLAKYVFWDILGDHLLNRIKSNFGANDQGYLRINPILNPLYLEYSDRRGVVYKFDIRSSYNFTPNRDISLRIKSGYSFKLKQLYYYIPFRFNYNKRRHAFFAIDVDHGRHVYSSEIANQFDDDDVDSLRLAQTRLDYFRDTFFKVYNNYDISDYWSFNVGFTFHKRDAIDKEGFRQLGLKHTYRTSAPRIEVQYRPLSWNGPAITLDYERGIKGFLNSDGAYERWEIDGSYIHKLPSLQALSLRLGGGYYAMKSGQQYFLDFSNFRQNNLRSGWNDDWSGEFELLRSAWYNSSNYYLRSNVTYESPLLVASRVPWCGHFIEMERIYLGAVMAEELKPYVEFGYGFTMRVASLAVFVGNRNGRFERIGCTFGFELFRKW